LRWFRTSLSTWLSRWRAGRWKRAGRRLLERGDIDGAVRALQQALRLCPGSFSALLLLSRAYLRSRDLFRAKSALVQARATNQRRFEASAPGEIALEGYDLSGLVTAQPAMGVAVAHAEPRVEARPGPGPRQTSLPLGDCRDLDEYARFQAMPPVAKDEIEDWDEVLADLLED
jgi:tetratricopeptide (TPR) repeat protein